MPPLLKRSLAMKRKSNTFKSPLNDAMNIQKILEKDVGDQPEQPTKSLKNRWRIIKSSPLSSFTEVKDSDTDLPFSPHSQHIINEPAVKDAYVQFVHHLSQKSSQNEQSFRSTPQLSQRKTDRSVDFSTFGTEDGPALESQDKMSLDSGISLSQQVLNSKKVKQVYLQNLVLDEDELDFMKNFKPTKKKLRVFPSYSDESINDTNLMIANKDKIIPKKNNVPIQKKNAEMKRMLEKEEKVMPVKKPVKKTKMPKPFEQPHLSLYEKMILIHESRNVGLYVLCDYCDKSRYLPHIKDPLDLPEKWTCSMNPDKNYNKCTDPEEDIKEEDKDYLIENEFNSGSIVWARVDGYPWWPAMVEDDPDYENYYWLEGSLKPVSYHVTFFDISEVTRAWLSPIHLKPFKINMDNPTFIRFKFDTFKKRLETAFKQASDAVNLPLIDRLRKYSFIERYPKGLNDLAAKINKGKTEHKEKKAKAKIGKQHRGKKLRKLISSVSMDAENADISMALINIIDDKAMDMSFDLLE